MSTRSATAAIGKLQVQAGICLLLALPSHALADLGATGTAASTARLDFLLNIGKFIFFRVGNSSAYPTASATLDTVSFTAAPTIPPSAIAPVTSNNTAVNWSGALPTLTATATSLPVEVRSNAGQISIRATATTALTSGANAIPLSQIVLTSTDANLPAPLVPNAGTGASVNVTGTAYANLVTVRSASWSFAYAPLTTQPAGVYSGQISFTASSP
jgi:hypothetical protein